MPENSLKNGPEQIAHEPFQPRIAQPFVEIGEEPLLLVRSDIPSLGVRTGERPEEFLKSAGLRRLEEVFGNFLARFQAPFSTLVFMEFLTVVVFLSIACALVGLAIGYLLLFPRLRE